MHAAGSNFAPGSPPPRTAGKFRRRPRPRSRLRSAPRSRPSPAAIVLAALLAACAPPLPPLLPARRLAGDGSLQTRRIGLPRRDDPRRWLAEHGELPPLRLEIPPEAWTLREDSLGIPGVKGPVWMVSLPLPVVPRGNQKNPAGMRVVEGGRPAARFSGRPSAGFSWIHDGRHLVLLPPARREVPPPDSAGSGDASRPLPSPSPCTVVYAVDPAYVSDPFLSSRAGDPSRSGDAPREPSGERNPSPARFHLEGVTFDGVPLEIPGEALWVLGPRASRGDAPEEATPPGAGSEGSGPTGAGVVLRFGLAAEAGGVVVEGDWLRSISAPLGVLEVTVSVAGEPCGRLRVDPASGAETVHPLRVVLPARIAAGAVLSIRVDRVVDGASTPPPAPVPAPPPARAWLVDPRLEFSREDTGDSTRTDTDESRRGIVLVVLDTLRRDRVGCYGSRRPTSPRLDAWARGGMRFARASSNANWTLPSHASMFLSRLPQEHGVWTLADTVRHDAPTLARLLQKQGLVTAAFTDGGLLRASFGLDQGFAEYHDRRRGAAGIFEAAGKWLEQSGGAPFFLFVHTYEVHAPYEASREVLREIEPGYEGPTSGMEVYAEALGEGEKGGEEGAPSRASRSGAPGAMELVRLAQQGELRADRLDPSRLAQLDTLYDGGVRTADASLGGFLGALDRLGLSDHVLVALTSDHGESLGEHHLLGHGGGYFEPELAIPLVLRGPGVPAGAVREERVSLVDLAPTVLDWWGLPSEPRHDGRSLLRAAAPGRPVIAAGYRRKARLVEFAVLEGNWKLVRTHRQVRAGRRSGLLFDLGRDPGESVDRSAEDPAVREHLERIFEESKPPPGEGADRATRRRPTIEEQDELRALGYGGGGGRGGGTRAGGGPGR